MLNLCIVLLRNFVACFCSAHVEDIRHFFTAGVYWRSEPRFFRYVQLLVLQNKENENTWEVVRIRSISELQAGKLSEFVCIRRRASCCFYFPNMTFDFARRALSQISHYPPWASAIFHKTWTCSKWFPAESSTLSESFDCPAEYIALNVIQWMIFNDKNVLENRLNGYWVGSNQLLSKYSIVLPAANNPAFWH